MPSFENDTVEVKGLDQILKALKRRQPTIKVGILGGSSRSGSKGITNAEVGAAHEYGTSKMPKRSFLRMPLATRLDKEMAASGAFDQDVLKEVMKSGKLLPWVTKVAILAHKTVLEAFATSGFGSWASWKGSYTSRTGQILVDTNQLRDSISSEVKE